MYNYAVYLHPCQNMELAVIFILAILTQWYLIMILICISLMVIKDK